MSEKEFWAFVDFKSKEINDLNKSCMTKKTLGTENTILKKIVNQQAGLIRNLKERYINNLAKTN